MRRTCHECSHQADVAATKHSGPIPFDCIALVLQGGGALGAYQAGVYEALAEADIQPNWVAGVSIGAINAAIIAGNPPNDADRKLREFWRQVTSDRLWSWFGDAPSQFMRGQTGRNLLNQLNANLVLAGGANGFFSARTPMQWLQPDGTIEATSFYDTRELKSTLQELVDFDRLNTGTTRLSVGAVNVRSGNFVYFDTTTHEIVPNTSWRAGRCLPAFRPSRSRASTTGMAVSCPIRRCNGWPTACRAATPWPFRSICGAPAESFHATCWK